MALRYALLQDDVVINIVLCDSQNIALVAAANGANNYAELPPASMAEPGGKITGAKGAGKLADGGADVAGLAVVRAAQVSAVEVKAAEDAAELAKRGG